jgi:hypothetical protein
MLEDHTETQSLKREKDKMMYNAKQKRENRTCQTFEERDAYQGDVAHVEYVKMNPSLSELIRRHICW